MSDHGAPITRPSKCPEHQIPYVYRCNGCGARGIDCCAGHTCDAPYTGWPRWDLDPCPVQWNAPEGDGEKKNNG